MRFERKNLLHIAFNQKKAWLWFLITMIAIVIVSAFGPAERSLGIHIRIVYLHGTWVWTSLAAFLTAGICGGLGLFTRRSTFHAWSGAFGRTGLVFWTTYLPLSLWAMQSNWNGLFLAEPRWRLAIVFAIGGLILQIGLGLADNPVLTSALNIGYLIALVFSLFQTPNVMHPASPIINSEAWHIQVYFLGLFLLTLFAAWQMARWWYKGEPNHI